MILFRTSPASRPSHLPRPKGRSTIQPRSREPLTDSSLKKLGLKVRTQLSAMLTLLKGRWVWSRHPYYWAAFSLMGDPENPVLGARARRQ